MIKELTQLQSEIITDLFHAVDGQALVKVSADGIHHSPLYWLAHDCRALIGIAKHKSDNKVYREVWLTERGVQFCNDNGIYAKEPCDTAHMPKADKRTRITVAFQLKASDRAVGLIQDCKQHQHFVPVVRMAVQLYAAIGIHGMKQLIANNANELHALQETRHHLDSERQRLKLEKAVLSEQTKEVQQWQLMMNKLQAMEQLLSERPAIAPEARISGLQPVQASTQAKEQNGLKRLDVPTFDLPDDEQIEFEIKQSVNENANANFLRSMFALIEKGDTE